MESNRLTIIVDDGAVYRDQGTYLGLDLSSCGIPQDVHVLQWMTDTGWIEYQDTRPNLDISELPDWATSCISVWESMYTLEHNA
jgi:hypothetical protein